jgi:hypothetical protein
MADFLVQLIEFIVQRCTLTNRVPMNRRRDGERCGGREERPA